jgi:electron transport complex protein RnfB
MKLNLAHRTLAEKMLFQQNNKDFNIPDSVLKIVSFAYTEEEIQIASHLGFIPRTAKVIARKVKRPLLEVEPVLKSLADRLLILSLTTKNKTTYSLLPLLPGVFELQIAVSKGKDEEYGREFARLFEDFYNELGDIIKPLLDDREKFEIGRVIPVEKSIKGNSSVNTIAFPSDYFSEIIDRNNSFALAECACRTSSDYLDNGCDKPNDVCSGMGLIADLIVDKGLARRVSKEEFIDTKIRAAEAGLVNLVDNILDPMQVCSCCGCCCVGLRFITKHNFPALIANSHFEPVIDTQNCEGCGKCIKWCPVNAISLSGDKKSSTIDYKRCIGCGVCVSKCGNNSISLKERANYQPPPDNIVNYAIHRYLDVKKYDKNGFIPRVSLGAGRLLSKFIDPKLTGPKYKPYI